MIFYHVSSNTNRASILKHGLFPSTSGLDGPGLYLWKGTQPQAVIEACISLSDSNPEINLQTLDVWGVSVPDGHIDTALWPEYGCFQISNVKAHSLSLLGDLDSLAKAAFTLPEIRLLSNPRVAMCYGKLNKIDERSACDTVHSLSLNSKEKQ